VQHEIDLQIFFFRPLFLAASLLSAVSCDMFRLIVIAAVAALLVASSAADYGSYVTICDQYSSNVTFVNFPLYDCQGDATLYVMPLNQCFPELNNEYSWNGFCNQTNMWYNNFNGSSCSGQSLLSRMYVTMSCQNCTNVECKNGAKSVYSFLNGIKSPRKANK
jgi:hypothetical protein